MSVDEHGENLVVVPSDSIGGFLAVGLDPEEMRTTRAPGTTTEQSLLRAVADDDLAGARTTSDNFALKVQRELRLSTRDSLENKLKTDEFTLNKLNLRDLGAVGREKEIRVLKMFFRGLLHSSPQDGGISRGRNKLVTISGCSGTGKTTLAHELRSEAIDRQGFFCVGKFDLRKRFEPYAAFAQAFSQLFDQIMHKGDNFATEMRSRIEKLVGTDRHVLTEVVPSLADFFDESGPTADTPTEASLEKRAIRLHILFRKFIQAICSNWNPLVVVLDDLQWADTASLDLVEALLTDDEDPLFMLVGTIRRNEIDEEHLVFKKIKALEEKGVTENQISLENLDIDAVRSIVSTALRASEEVVHSLAVIVHTKTHGNPFFVIQFLQSLVDKKLLQFSFAKMGWTWDEGRIEELVVTDNVADLLMSKLEGLCDELQQLLQVSACLGQRFHEATLSIAYKRVLQTHVFPKVVRLSSVQSLCDLAVKEGILHRGTGSMYVFAHDHIQEAASNLILEERHLLMKLRIGERLLYCGTRHDNDHQLFLAVDLCNSALGLLDNKEKVGLAKYNLLAGEKAMKKSAFIPAKQYFECGLKCLGPEAALTDSYREWLNLTTGIVEATYCCGDIDTMHQYVERVVDASCPFEDKIRVYSTRILLLTAQERFREAMSTGVHVLEKMGMARFSEFPSTLTVLKEMVRTKMFMRKYNREKLLNLPELADKKRILAMGIIDMMVTATFPTSPHLYLVSFFASLRWSVRYGVSKYSPTAFATFGVVLSGMGDAKEGAVFGDIALELSERLKAKDTLSKTLVAVYAYVRHWSHDLRSCIKPLLYSYQVGMETGDVEIAMLGVMSHDWAVFCTASRPLERLLSDVESHVSRARDYKQKAAEAFGVRLQQLLLNLLGRCVDPLVLTGSAMDQEVMYKLARDEKSKGIEVEMDCCRIQLAFLLGCYKQADALSKRTANLGTKELRGSMLVPRVHAYRAMTWLALARDGIERNTNLRRAGRVVKLINQWYKNGNVNVLHMLKLLLAARTSCCRRRRRRGRFHGKTHKEVVTNLYREAIQCASRGGFLQDKALCHEWAAQFYLEHDKNSYWAAYHLGNAVECYEKWGATILVSRLRKKYGKLLGNSLRGSALGDCVVDHSQRGVDGGSGARRNSVG